MSATAEWAMSVRATTLRRAKSFCYYGGYGLPYITYGYGDGCEWLHRRASSHRKFLLVAPLLRLHRLKAKALVLDGGFLLCRYEWLMFAAGAQPLLVSEMIHKARKLREAEGVCLLRPVSKPHIG